MAKVASNEIQQLKEDLNALRAQVEIQKLREENKTLKAQLQTQQPAFSPQPLPPEQIELAMQLLQSKLKISLIDNVIKDIVLDGHLTNF